jgi:hypothetical protein
MVQHSRSASYPGAAIASSYDFGSMHACAHLHVHLRTAPGGAFACAPNRHTYVGRAFALTGARVPVASRFSPDEVRSASGSRAVAATPCPCAVPLSRASTFKGISRGTVKCPYKSTTSTHVSFCQ